MRGRIQSLALALLLAAPLVAQQPERWLHLRVEHSRDGELVRVNIPLALAEKVLPAIHSHKLKNGKVKIRRAHVDEVDLRAILEAVRQTRDGEFVTVESKNENVRVAKSGGYLLIQVRETKGDKLETVDIKLPMSVVEAALSGPADELDLLAAIRALSAHGDAVLIEVRKTNETVRVWVDTKSTQD